MPSQLYAAIYGGNQLRFFFFVFLGLFFPWLAVAEQPGIRLELNKLENVGEACRVYLLVEEKSGQHITRLDADFVLFDEDGIIIKRYLVPLAPMAAGQSRVRLFDLPSSSCDQISGILFNGTLNCSVDGSQDCPKFVLQSKDNRVTLF